MVDHISISSEKIINSLGFKIRMKFSTFAQIKNELLSFIRSYPSFVYSKSLFNENHHVPVFVYHSIDPELFERDLVYLKNNNYTTIGMSELVDFLEGRRKLKRKTVVLTFDDARSSFWIYAYPLIKKHDMKAVLFIIPGLTESSDSIRDNLDMVWKGRASKEDLYQIDPEDTTLCSWPELKDMYHSGSVEIESHSLFHKEVFVNTEVLNVLGPNSDFVAYETPTTAYLNTSDIGCGIQPENYYGLPVFKTVALHKARPALNIQTSLIDYAKNLWNRFNREISNNRILQNELLSHWKKFEFSKFVNRETQEQLRGSLIEDIGLARELIKSNISEQAGDHFCLPWGIGSEMSIEIQKYMGLKSCTWTTIPYKRYNLAGDSIWKICRLKSDFIRRLPGDGQVSLAGIYKEKFFRRLRGDNVF